MNIVTPGVVPWVMFVIMTIAMLGLIGIRDRLVSLGAFATAVVVGAVIIMPAPLHLNADQVILTLLLSVGGCAAGAIVGIIILLSRRDRGEK